MHRSPGLIAVATFIFLYGCALFEPSKQPSEQPVIIGKIADEPVTLAELKNQFHKSSSLTADSGDDQALSDFLPLYMDYRLKLAIARDAGYMDDPAILSELSEYERQSAYPFWIERHIRDKLLDEIVERAGEHIHAQHILIELPEEAPPGDTLYAWNRLMEARVRFTEGEDFMKLSNEISSQRRGQSMGGDLGYFTAGWAVKPFEDAAYNTPVGEVSMPFRTQFGYHIVHVRDRRPTGPNKRFSHIFFLTRGTSQPVDSILVTAQKAYRELQEGKEWFSVVEAYSQDEQSRLSGGGIGWIRYGMYDPAFTDSIMQIEKPGQFTRPFESVYGVHIVKLDSIYQPSHEEIREEMSARLAQLPRMRDNERAVLDHAARTGEARFHRENLARFEEVLREELQPGLRAADLPEELLTKPVFSFHGQQYRAADYLEWLLEQLEQEEEPLYHHAMSGRYRDAVIDSELISLTRSRFPEFSELSRDYLTGLSVFRVNEDSIWTYAQQDTARLREIFENNTNDYRFDTRYRYIRFSARADSTLDQVRERIESGELIDSIRQDFSNVVMRRDIITNLNEEPYSNLKDLEAGQFSPYFEYRRRQTTLLLEEILEARPMTFEEAFNKLVTDYQMIREKEWIEAMRKKYRVEIYPEVLVTAH